MSDTRLRRGRRLPLLLVVLLWAAACGGDRTDEQPDPAPTTAVQTTAAQTTAAQTAPADAAVLEVPEGGAIQIGSLQAMTGDIGYLGVPHHRITLLAVEDYGPIMGREVSVAGPVDTLCSTEGGSAAAEVISDSPQVLGWLGTSCSSAASAAAPAVSEGLMVMVSASATAPSLTSDLAGSAGADWSRGFYRTAPNDLFFGQAVAEFVSSRLELDTAAVVHTGDIYSREMVQAFTDHFTELGGAVTASGQVDDDPDVADLLSLLAEGRPQVVFLPYYPPMDDYIVQQIRETAELANAVVVGYGAAVGAEMVLPGTDDFYLVGPVMDHSGNRSEITGRTADEVLAEYRSRYGEEPTSPFWAQAYDAAAMLLQAIESAAEEGGGSLLIDRDALRSAMDATDFSGLGGRVVCDDFGDCGVGPVVLLDVSGAPSGSMMDYLVFTYNPSL